MTFAFVRPSRKTPNIGVVGLAFSALIAAASPAAAITEYLGGGFLTVTDSCAEFGWTGTHQVLVRMAPQGMDGNSETETQIALFMPAFPKWHAL